MPKTERDCMLEKIDFINGHADVDRNVLEAVYGGDMDELRHIHSRVRGGVGQSVIGFTLLAAFSSAATYSLVTDKKDVDMDLGAPVPTDVLAAISVAGALFGAFLYKRGQDVLSSVARNAFIQYERKAPGRELQYPASPIPR